MWVFGGLEDGKKKLKTWGKQKDVTCPRLSSTRPYRWTGNVPPRKGEGFFPMPRRRWKNAELMRGKATRKEKKHMENTGYEFTRKKGELTANKPKRITHASRRERACRRSPDGRQINRGGAMRARDRVGKSGRRLAATARKQHDLQAKTVRGK